MDLPDGTEMGVGPAMAVAIEGQYACILQGSGEGTPGRLLVADVSRPGEPVIVGELAGLPCGRQIVVRQGVAYFTARWNGAYIVDVGDPRRPRLLRHYDSVECATGIGLSGHILLIANRGHGVEVIDVADPNRPVHLSTVRTGEAQSVAARDGILYAGVWETSEVVVADIHKPRRPIITARLPLDGYGDGVHVRGNHLYASTGHHSRRLGLPHERTIEMFPKNEGLDLPGFGEGHGVEIFDLSDPAHPSFISRVKFPKYYRPANDMWSAVVSGDFAFCADTHNGLFVVNVKNPEKPEIVARKQLRQVNGVKGLMRPEENSFEGVVTGLAVLDGFIYAAGPYTDVHVIPAPQFAARPQRQPDNVPPVPPEPPDRPKGYRLYKPYGQVRGVVFMDDLALVAAGMGGVRVARLWPRVEEIAHLPTEDIAYSVTYCGRFAYVAEGAAGLTVWEHEGDGRFARRGRCPASGHALLRHVLLPSPGKYALAQAGNGLFQVIDVSDPDKPVIVLTEWRAIQRLDVIGHGLLGGRYACMYGVLGKLFWYDMEATPHPTCIGETATLPWGYGGLAAVGEHFLFTAPGGYVLVDPQCDDVGSLEICAIANDGIAGKPRVYGDRLYLSDSSSGRIQAVDISDLRHPRLLKQFVTEGNPGGVVEHRGAVIVPDGYEGLRIYPSLDDLPSQ